MAADARARLPLAALLALAALGCDAPFANPAEPGYDPTSLTGGMVYHWAPGKTIRVFADQTGLDPGDFNIAEAVSRGVKAWRETVLYREVNVRLVSSPADADMIVHYKFAPRLVSTVVGGSDCNVGSTGAAGYTLFCPDTGDARVLPLLAAGGPTGHVKMDIFVDPFQLSGEFLSQQGVSRIDAFYSLVAHELGHALGIGAHSDVGLDLMYPIPLQAGPSVRDAATLQFVLHQKADIRF